MAAVANDFPASIARTRVLFERMERTLNQIDARLKLLIARRAGATTLSQIAAALTARSVPATRGGHRWAPAQVRRILRAPKSA